MVIILSGVALVTCYFKMKHLISHSAFLVILVIKFSQGDLAIFGKQLSERSITEGNSIALECYINGSHPVRIFLDLAERGSDQVIVSNWQLKDYSSKFHYKHIRMENNVVKHTLYINNISRADSGIYVCLQLEPSVDQKSIELNVQFKSSVPICTTSRDTVFFTDETINETLMLTCLIEDVGNPSSSSSFIMAPPNTELTSTSLGRKREDTLSFVPLVSMNNSVINCSSVQEFASPTTDEVTHQRRSCSFPPILFLRELSIKILPMQRNVSEPGNYSFLCSDNALNLSKIEWDIRNPFSSHVTHSLQHNVVTFHVSHIGEVMTHEIECIGTFRNQTIKERGWLHIQKNGVASNFSISMFVYVIMVITVSVCN